MQHRVDSLYPRLTTIWRQAFNLARPVMVEHILRTLMQTTDVLIAGVFSPTVVAAVGLGDLYSRVLTRVGLALGGGAIAISSQDTGSDAKENRDETIIQALFLGFLSGLPFIILVLEFSSWALLFSVLNRRS